MAGRRPGLFELLQEADLSGFYNDLRSVLRICHVQQLKDVTEEDLMSIGMTRNQGAKLKQIYSKYNTGYVCKLKKLLLPNWTKDEFLLDEENSSEIVPSPPSTTANLSMPLPSPLAIEAVVFHQGMEIKVPRQHLINPKDITIYKELGNGEFGVVQQGVWIDSNQDTHQVAIKSLSKERMQNSTVEFMKEYEIMQTIQHENIVSVFGVVLESSSIMIITELAPLRSLLECLKEPSLRNTLNVPTLTNFATQICAGMRYLESRRLIHRDLAARNILVFSRHLVKVSDFGLSRALGVGKDYYQTNFTMTLKLPIAWCAPECITFLKFTSASDVWAFAVTLWEMFSYGFQPWAAQTGQQILEAIDEPNRKRLDRPHYCPAEYYQMMLQCWHHEPHSRPTFAQLCSILEDIRPEQVRAVSSAIRDTQPGYLPHDVGHVMTVLDKNLDGPDTWRGVLDHNGHVGLFHPSKTVAYYGQAPKSSFAKNLDFFNSSKLSKKRLSRELISTPQASRLEDNSDMVPLISSVPITPTKPANRMGHTIGYIRDKSSTSTFGVPVQDAKHEYHCIDDKENDDEDDLFKPLDLGPSMLDEVLSEIGGAAQDKKTDTKKDQLKDIVSNTLHMRRHKKKQLATVKPIKASDEKALESAIAMANALASKSMHDIDKRSDFDSSPLDSPSKKFSFFFPSSNQGNHQKSSPKAERRSFLSKKKLPEISDQERNAYKELVGECESLPPLTKLGTPISQSIACFPTSWSSPEHQDHFLQMSPPPGPAPEVPTMLDNNPLPLPPRNHTLNRMNPPKRHVRKNPLIVPSAMVSNMLRNEETIEKRNEPLVDNAFDHVLEQSIDALDNIGDEGGEEALFLDHQGAMAACGSSRKDADCDEVRIMMKVLGRCANAGDCFNALHMTQWNMHHAIKFVKLKNLIKANVSNEDMLTRLHIENWDVAKAASSIMKNLQ